MSIIRLWRCRSLKDGAALWAGEVLAASGEPCGGGNEGGDPDCCGGVVHGLAGDWAHGGEVEDHDAECEVEHTDQIECHAESAKRKAAVDVVTTFKPAPDADEEGHDVG